jgi:hypothetical protein
VDGPTLPIAILVGLHLVEVRVLAQDRIHNTIVAPDEIENRRKIAYYIEELLSLLSATQSAGRLSIIREPLCRSRETTLSFIARLKYRLRQDYQNNGRP